MQKDEPMSTIPRYHKLYDMPDKFTCDVVYVDRLTGKEIMRYDGADPANTNPEYGAEPDSECFANRGLNLRERIEASKAVPEGSYINRYETEQGWDDYD